DFGPRRSLQRRFQGSPRTASRQARSRSRHCRRAQHSSDWTTGFGQDHARKTLADDSAAAGIRSGAGANQDSFRRGANRTCRFSHAAAVSFAAPHDQRRRLDRGRRSSPSWRSLAGPSRRSVSRRAAGIRSERFGSPAPAARRSESYHQPRRDVPDLSCLADAGRGDESVSLRILERSNPRVPLHATANSTLRGPHLRPAAGSHRHSHRCSRGETPPDAEDSATIRQRVINARARQGQRFSNEGIFSNSAMTPRLIRKYCRIDAESETMLERAMSRLGLSARAYDRILKVSRTIADLDNSEAITSAHVSEAVHYRSLDRTYWTSAQSHVLLTSTQS